MNNDNREHFKIPFTVVLLLGGISVLLIVGIIALLAMGKPVDAAFYTIAGTAVGALGSVLSSTRGTNNALSPDAPIPVTTEPGKPLETTDVTGSVGVQFPPTAEEGSSGDVLSQGNPE